MIDGWALRPDKVRRLGPDNVTSFRLIAAPSVLEERERKNAAALPLCA